MSHLTLLIWGLFWPAIQDDAPPQAEKDLPSQVEETDTGFRIGVAVDQVFLSVNARSAQGGFLRGLTRDQFSVYEDGVRQEILNFYSEALPVRVVLLVDVSGSTRGSQSEIRRAALRFVDSLGEEDQIAVITFSSLPKLILDWTNDRQRIQNAMLKIYAKGRTVLNDALYVTCDDLLAGVSGRKAIILLSDGIDTNSMVTPEEALDLVTRSEAMTYVASTVEAYWRGAMNARVQLMSRGRLIPRQMTDEYIIGARKFLRTLADRTGGRVLDSEAFQSLSDVYVRVAEELKNQYYISYRPTNPARDGSWRDVTIRAAVPGAVVHTRPGYYAPGSPPVPRP